MVELERMGRSLEVLDYPQETGAADGGTSIADVFRVPGRFLRSTHLERDFDDPSSIDRYVITPPIVASLIRIIEGLHRESGHRAWRVTGDYGTGKSSFALVLAHLLQESTSATVSQVREAIERESTPGASDLDLVRMLPVLVTGAREPLVPAVARALQRSLARLPDEKHSSEVIGQLESRLASVAESRDATQLLSLMDQVRSYAAKLGYSGIFLVLDELGKFLEYAALRPHAEDVYILQRLAEAATRSGASPLVVLGLLHQGFHAYAENLPYTQRQEWEKVGGRYGEITFDQPLFHVASLVKEALNVDVSLISEDVVAKADNVRAAALSTGWFGTLPEPLSPLDLYPLHPTVLPVLVRFFARFGQHERSLLSFLLSSEPFGLQDFARRTTARQSWYRLSDFYDYVRNVFGHRLAGGSYRSHWLRISDTIDRMACMAEIDNHQLMVLKTVAVLNILDAEHLLANEPVVTAALEEGYGTGAVSRALVILRRWGLLFDRGRAGGYCLWPSTSISLEATLEDARRVLGPVESVSAQLRPYLSQSSIVARRHYIESGTLRHFEVRYADPKSALEATEQPTQADGLVLIVLCDSWADRREVLAKITRNGEGVRAGVLIAVTPPLQSITTEVQDAHCWQWIADNTPELNLDSYAAPEVARQVAASRRLLHKTLDSIFGFRGEAGSEMQWWYCGKVITLPRKGGLSAKLSDICDELYFDAPRIRNELLNRRSLSSAASAARLRLIGRMFSALSEPALGFEDGKAPPEKSMYLSVLRAGNVHIEENGVHVLSEPPEDTDNLHLRPALLQILVQLERANGRRVPVIEIFDVLQCPPLGVRMGVAPLLLAITVVAHAHEIAVYENGTYLHSFDSPDFLRLTKQPSTFELQLCRVQGVRKEVFRLLARIFAQRGHGSRENELLDVVRPLSVFAAQLPEYTRKNTMLQEPVKSVRDALLTAREPSTLIFESLPIACGFDPFPIVGNTNTGQEQQFVEVLQGALTNLHATYPKLLANIRQKITVSLGDGGVEQDRAEIALRASQIMLAAREPRLEAFARSLADGALSDDSWAERIGSIVVSKPPTQWTAVDEARAMEDIDRLVQTFNRTETTVFGNGTSYPDSTAMRISLTNADGHEAAHVIRVPEEDEPSVQELSERIEELLNGATRPDLKYAAIAYLLKKNFAKQTNSLRVQQE